MIGVPRRPWISQGAIVVLGDTHDLPKHLKKFLPKFDPDNRGSPEDHVSKFFLAVSLMGVQHEDVVCRLFPYTFEGKTSTWYFALPQGIITRWNDFEISLMKKFGETRPKQLWS